jgi:hypothetical protein
VLLLLCATQAMPVVGIVGAGCVFMCYKIWHATWGPDSHFNRSERSVPPYERRNQAAEGLKWAEEMKNGSRWSRPGLDVGQVTVFESPFKPTRVEGVAERFGPAPPAAARP